MSVYARDVVATITANGSQEGFVTVSTTAGLVVNANVVVRSSQASLEGKIERIAPSGRVYIRPAQGFGLLPLQTILLADTPVLLQQSGVCDDDETVEFSDSPVIVVPWVATTVLDLSPVDTNKTIQLLQLAGNTTFDTVNIVAGRESVIIVKGDGSIRNLTFPAGWVWVSAIPATISANDTAKLILTALGPSNSDIVADWRT